MKSQKLAGKVSLCLASISVSFRTNMYSGPYKFALRMFTSDRQKTVSHIDLYKSPLDCKTFLVL